MFEPKLPQALGVSLRYISYFLLLLYSCVVLYYLIFGATKFSLLDITIKIDGVDKPLQIMAVAALLLMMVSQGFFLAFKRCVSIVSGFIREYSPLADRRYVVMPTEPIKPWLDFVLIPLVFIVLAIIMTWPIAAGLDRYLSNGGDPVFNSWVIWRINENILTNPLSLMEGNIFFPYKQVMAYSETMISCALLVLPIHIFSGHPIVEYNSLLILSFALNGFGVYLLARKIVGNRWAAVLAGLIFAFSMPRYNHIQHLQMLLSFWMPIAFLLWIRFLENPTNKNGALFVFGAVLVLLSNMHFAIYFTYSILLWFLYETSVYGFDRATALVKKLIIPLVPALLLLMPIFLPYMGNEPRERWDIANYTASLSSYINPNPGGWLYGHFGGGGAMWFPGIVAILFAVTGLIYFVKKGQIKDRALPLFLILGLLAFWASLGVNYGLYEILYSYAPGFDGIRAVERIGIIYLLSLSIFAALGFTFLIEKSGKLKTIAPLIACGLFLVESVSIADTMYAHPKESYLEFEWLGKLSEVKNILYLPMEYEETRQTLASVYHGKNMVNGYSGYFPPLYKWFKKTQKSFPTVEQIKILQAINVDHILMDGRRMSLTPLMGKIRALRDLTIVETTKRFILLKVEPREIPHDHAALMDGDVSQFFNKDGLVATSLRLARKPVAEGSVIKMAVEVINNADHGVPPNFLSIRVSSINNGNKVLTSRNLSIIPANSSEVIDIVTLAPSMEKESSEIEVVVELLQNGNKIIDTIKTTLAGSFPGYIHVPRVRASATRFDTGNMIDGDLDSRWTTHTPLTNDDWVILEFDALTKIENLALVNYLSFNNHPSGLEIFSSGDGKIWKSVGRYEKLDVVKLREIEILFLKFDPIKTRLIKLVPTGAYRTSWWSIHELLVY